MHTLSGGALVAVVSDAMLPLPIGCLAGETRALTFFFAGKAIAGVSLKVLKSQPKGVSYAFTLFSIENLQA